jgi:hypothetical protein
MTEQKLINALLTLYVNGGLATKLDAVLSIGLVPDSSLNLKEMAGQLSPTIGEGRDAVLNILLNRLPEPANSSQS